MSRDHTGCIRGFHQVSRAWYALFRRNHKHELVLEDGSVDRFNFGMYHRDGGTTGEMQMVFEELVVRVVPRLKCYDDGWSALASFTDLIARMGEVDNDNITPDQFREMLLECGFADLTKERQE